MQPSLRSRAKSLSLALLHLLFPLVVLTVLRFDFLDSQALGIVSVLEFYPVMVNAFLLLSFATSLFLKQSVCERFARAGNPDLPLEAIGYCRKATFFWCVFFLLNGCISLYTALYASPEIWALYNGLISYLLLGAFFFVEYTVRRIVKRRIICSRLD